MTADKLTNSGTVASAGDLQVRVRDLSGAGGILYGRNTRVEAKQADSVGTVTAQEQLDVQAEQLNIEQAGQLAAGQAVNVMGDQIRNQGTVQGPRVAVNAERLDNAGSIQAGDLTIKTQVFQNTGQALSLIHI